MSAMPYPAIPSFAHRKHHVVITGVLIVLFWAVAALLVLVAHQEIDSISTRAGVVVKIAVIIGIGFAYMALTARDATVDHALLVGTLWLLLAIIGEVVMTAHIGRAWFELLGAPTKPLYRCFLMFAWVAAPALFARARS